MYRRPRAWISCARSYSPFKKKNDACLSVSCHTRPACALRRGRGAALSLDVTVCQRTLLSTATGAFSRKASAKVETLQDMAKLFGDFFRKKVSKGEEGEEGKRKGRTLLYII